VKYLSSKKRDKKKSIKTKDILKVIKDVEFLDLGEPFGESARRFLAYKLTKMIENEEIKGTVVTPEGVYISLTSKEVKDIVNLINAMGICDLEKIAEDNNWNTRIVKLIAKNRINIIYRQDKKVITQKTALDLLLRQVNQNQEIKLEDLATELQIKKSQVNDLLKKLIEDKRVDGYFLKSSEKFLVKELLEESIKELIFDYEMKKVTEVTFTEIAEEYDISDDQVYNILLKLYNSGDIDVQLNLGQKLCLIRENIEDDEWEERVPEEEKRLEIEDLTQKK
jgi:Mn-dependent DtxR family transcriptional regulator